MGSGVMAKRLAGLCPLGRCGVLKDVARVQLGYGQSPSHSPPG